LESVVRSPPVGTPLEVSGRDIHRGGGVRTIPGRRATLPRRSPGSGATAGTPSGTGSARASCTSSPRSTRTCRCQSPPSRGQPGRGVRSRPDGEDQPLHAVKVAPTARRASSIDGRRPAPCGGHTESPTAAHRPDPRSGLCYVRCDGSTATPSTPCSSRPRPSSAGSPPSG
jgi:hypothetical protein